jgi:hypothetical protein
LWVAPLLRDQKYEIDFRRNPFYEHATAALFVAYQGRRPAGRIAAIENRLHNQHWQDQVGFFGFYEAEDNLAVSRALFAAAESWLHGRGLDRMRGPTNPSMNTNVGFLIEGFEFPPSMPMPYTRPYYKTQAEDAGLRPAMDVFVYGWNYDDYSDAYVKPRWQRIVRLSERVRSRAGIRIRTVRRDRVDEELENIRNICNESLKDNWGFVPLTDGEMRAARRDLEHVTDLDMFHFAEIDGRPEAVFFACPDYNELLARMKGRIWPWGWLTYLRYRRHIKRYVVYVYAATPRADAMGVGVALYERFFGECFRKGIKSCETGYVLETNTRMRNSIENFGAHRRKTYQLYEKVLNDPAPP